MKKIPFALLFLTILIFGCKSDKKDVAPADLESTWELVELNGNPVNSEDFQQRGPFIQLDTSRSRMNGFTGCVDIRADFNLNTDKGTIKFRRVLRATKTCKNSIDKPYGKAFYDVNNFRIEGNNLYLSKGQNDLMVFETE